MKKYTAILGLLLLMATASSTAYANPWWIDVAAGGSGLILSDSNLGWAAAPGVSAGIDANYMITQHQLISVRAIENVDFPFFPIGNFDTGVLYGVIAKSQKVYISASAGIGYMNLSVPDLFSNSSTSFGSLAIPLEVNLGYTPTQHLGFGLKLFGDIGLNQKVSNLAPPHLANAGVMLELQFGNLRF